MKLSRMFDILIDRKNGHITGIGQPSVSKSFAGYLMSGGYGLIVSKYRQ